ncbi:hypothetical protein PFISCL1PPCAC_12763 [Pristionchus fissidentatus]|uniref:Dehydrogenase n=1 Tax=Pristionchus fissidentatus TaxID=1538716 RepID=A0AAV5VPF1_9BILA|nr:hypothetical protein PFISCL1PPCAC_12763 [Pristionchus fissidentatus]
MTSVLVTGANRGIGLGLVRQLVEEPSVAIVFAAARNVDTAKDLTAISSPKLHLVSLEIVSEESIARAHAKVSEIVGDRGLDLLINNAGIFNAYRLAGAIDKAGLMQQFEVNAVGPILLVNKFHGLLKKAAAKKGFAQIANITSALGSLETACEMSAPMPTALYAMSKAAANMLTRKLCVEFREDKIRATSFCPGWVRTDMGTDAAALSLEESTVPLAKLILALQEENNGLFYRYNGEAIPW